MPLHYMTVLANSADEAREYLGDLSHAYEGAPLVHHEPATEQGECATFVFQLSGHDDEDYTGCDMLHDLFTLPHLTNAPVLRLEDF